MRDRISFPGPSLQGRFEIWKQAFTEFYRECRKGGNKLSKVKSVIILQSGERVTSFTKDNSAIFSSEKW